MTAHLLCLALLLTPCTTFADEVAPLRIALEKQSKFKTVSVKIKQTKKIPALTEDIVLTGHLWLKPGQAFRWELGDPLVQSAVYDGTTVFLIDEKKKTAVALDPGDRRAKPLLLMLGFGEGASFEKMLESFTVGSTTTVGEHFVVSLMPKGRVKRAITLMVMQFKTRTSFLDRIEWTQKDGTVAITEFYPPVIDKELPAGIFDVKRESYTWE
jgi:outer membrane lipoprotein-sorting protein